MSDHGDAPGQVQEEGSGVGLAPAQDSFHVQRQGDIAEIDDSYDNTDFEQSSEERLDAGDSSEAEQIENYQDEATGRQTKRDAEMYEDIRSELEHLSEMQVDPEVGMKVAKSRMHLQKSGILDEVAQMRRAMEKKNGNQAGMSLRKYNVSPSLHARVTYGQQRHGTNLGGGRSLEPRGNVLPPRPAPRSHSAALRLRPDSSAARRRPPVENTPEPQRRPMQRKKGRRTDPYSQSAGIRALTRSILSRPISAPPQLREPTPTNRRYGAVHTSVDGLLTSMYGTPGADTKIAFKDSIRASPKPGASQSRGFKIPLPPPCSDDLSNWLFNGTIEDIFGKDADAQDPQKQLHNAAVQRAGEKMVKEGKANSVQDAMRRMKEHWYSRTGEWKHYAWSHFGAEHKHWAATPWFGKDTKEIGDIVGEYAEPPMDPELSSMLKTFNPAVKDKLYVLGAGTVEGVLKLPTKEMKDAGIHKTEEQLLREKASQIVSTGSRGQRAQRRMVNAMLAQPDEHKRKKNPQQLASELQGMFFAAAGDGDTITVEDLLASVQGAGVALTDDDAKELTSLLASQAEARGIEDWGGHLTLDDCFDLFWLVPLNDGDVRLDMPSIHPHADPRSPGSPTSELGSPGARGIYSPAKAAKEWHSIVPDDLPWGNFSAFATGKSLPPREGPSGEGALQDDGRLCVFIESCTAIRGHSKSLRGSQNRYDDLSHELMDVIERIRLEPPPVATINPGISQLLVTAVRRGGERWARQHADHLRKTEWMNSRYPRYGAMEVWAFFPHEPAPTCLYSKLEEKKFPHTDDIISRIVDHLNVNFEDCAPPGIAYTPPAPPPILCANCRKGKVRALSSTNHDSSHAMP